MYQALYRKWRPRTFDDVVGQSHITETLKRQIRENRLSHAYLFTGTRGTGKTTCAKLLARAANCLHPVDGNPCNQCDACRGIENGSIVEVLELDAASNNGVDQIRALRDDAVYSPAAVRKRVYIVDEVHMLSIAAFNALLKILEEPPEHLMFILATTELHKVPATIKSRCQQFAFKRISPAAIAGRLSYVAEQEGIALTTGGAELLSRLADGGMRDALSLLDQCAVGGGELGEREILDALGLAGNLETAALMADIANNDAGAALERLDRLYAAGKDVGSLLNELATLTRDLLIRETAPKGGAALMTGGFDEGVLRELSAALKPPRLAQILGRVQAVTADLGRSANRRVDAELCLIRLCDQTLDDSPAGLNARLTRLEELAASGGLAPTGASVCPVTIPQPAARSVSRPRKPEPVQPAPPSAGEQPPWDMAPPPVEEYPAPAAPAAAAPPPAEEMPPWDMEPPPLPEEPPMPRPEPLRPAPRPAPEPAKPAPVPKPQSTPAPAAPQPVAPVVGDFWPEFAEMIKARIHSHRGEVMILTNVQMVQGRIEGRQLKLWVKDQFIKNMISKQDLLTAVEGLTAALPGGPYRAAVVIGEAPPPAAASAGGAAALTGGHPDMLRELVANSRQYPNVIIKE